MKSEKDIFCLLILGVWEYVPVGTDRPFDGVEDGWLTVFAYKVRLSM